MARHRATPGTSHSLSPSPEAGGVRRPVLRGVIAAALVAGSTLLALPAEASAAPAAPAASSATTGSNALAIALRQQGKPYVWGATGPSSFDCSGLTLYAFRQAGASLPRTSSAQSNVGTPVSISQLRPGDLVFFYSPVSHVGIYAGAGNVVHASQPGQPVKTSKLSSMPFHNARRIG